MTHFAADQFAADSYAEGSVCMIADDCYSDLYKDVFGTRPRNWNVWRSVEAFDYEYGNLVSLLSDSITNEKKAEESAFANWIADIHATARKVRATVGDVIRWQFDAEGLKVRDKSDRDYFCFLRGFGYDMSAVIAKTQMR